MTHNLNLIYLTLAHWPIKTALSCRCIQKQHASPMQGTSKLIMMDLFSSISLVITHHVLTQHDY
jgi:hypothetical protein